MMRRTKTEIAFMIGKNWKSRIALAAAIATLTPYLSIYAYAGDNEKRQFRGQVGADSWKIRHDGDKTFIWAGGDREGAGAHWYDFTGSVIPPEKLQFGIGKDRIRAIDDPVFVSPDDPRLLKVARRSPYRPKEVANTNDDIMVIGFVESDEARAYPAALLDHHELVNDEIHGKPLTIGW